MPRDAVLRVKRYELDAWCPAAQIGDRFVTDMLDQDVCTYEVVSFLPRDEVELRKVCRGVAAPAHPGLAKAKPKGRVVPAANRKGKAKEKA